MKIMKESVLSVELNENNNVEIKIDDRYINSTILNLSDEFFNMTELFFKDRYGINKLEYNNYRMTFWAWK
ncbi:hypothetical protein [Oceanobacillus oncorhynchi]|uniref:hypothetical protein n=1 Tax=Oceanobacillus oncorhynchi TaxID=545501 RepID=UPI0034D5BD6A